MLSDLLRRLFARPRRSTQADFGAAFQLLKEGRLDAAELGYLDCVVETTDRYVELAVRLAREPDLRTQASREIMDRSGALSDRRDIALALGEFLEKAVLAAARSPGARAGAH